MLQNKPRLFFETDYNEIFYWENLFSSLGIWKPRLWVFVWKENILKTELFENDDVLIIMWFPSRV